MFRWKHLALCVFALGGCVTPAAAPEAVVSMHRVDAASAGASAGEIALFSAPDGVQLRLHLRGMPPGDHGMHLHAVASCDPGANAAGDVVPAGAAGGHFDPAATGRHEGPAGNGHLGDLPLVHVEADGTANVTLIASRLRTVAAFRGHAIIIHANGDNYSDTPAPLGGGGGRIACGVVN